MLVYGKNRRGWLTTCSTLLNQHFTHQQLYFLNIVGKKRKGNRHIKSVVGGKRQPISCQSKWREIYGSGKPPSKVHPTNDKGRCLIECSSTNIPTWCNTERYKEDIILNKEGTIDTEKVTLVLHSNYQRRIKEDTVIKQQQQQQQQGLAVPNPDIVNPSKLFISDKYNNQM